MISRRALSTALLAATAGLPAAVLAQQPTALPPVEVVATRRPEKPHDVPASIEVISGANLRARGATSLRDALALAAGVAIAPGGDGGPASAVPEFWGLREFDAFLLVVDNVPWGGALNPALSTLNLRDVERIEILRGPAPVTYGATSFVGVIHVVHKASAETSRTVSARGGSYGSGALGLDYGFGAKGPWKSRASVDLERMAFKDDATSANRGHLLWRTGKTGDNGSTWLTADVNVLRQDPASPHPREGATLSTAVPLDANHNPKDAFVNETRFLLSGGFDKVTSAGGRWGTTFSFTHSGQRVFRGFLVDISNTNNNATGFRENIDINDVYADTHLLFPVKGKVSVMAGADLLFAKGEAKGATFDYTAPLAGATQTTVTEPANLNLDSEDQRLFGGLYGSLEWRPVSRVTLSGGLRLNATSEKRGEGESSNHAKLSGTAGALFSILEQGPDHLRAFGTFSSTFKPAAFDFGLAENEGVLEPETSTSWEGGFKATAANGRFGFEASAFLMDFKNLVTATIVNNLPALVNGGKTRFRGFEFAADVALPRDLSLRGTYSFHDGKFRDYVQDFGGTLTQLAGKRFEMSARHLASGGFVYAPASGLLATATVNYTGNRYLNKRNTALVPGFTTFDAGLGYRIKRAEFRIDGRNLGNRRDAVSESEFGDAQYYRMTARSIQAGMVLSF